MELVFVAAVAIALIALWLSARAAVTVCLLDITGGHVVVRRGGLAPRILADIGDVVARPKIARATVRIVRERGHAVLEVKGAVPPEQLQQLRNVVGSVPLDHVLECPG